MCLSHLNILLSNTNINFGRQWQSGVVLFFTPFQKDNVLKKCSSPIRSFHEHLHE